MAEFDELMRICAVGGNAVSAFLSWRLQATNACDVTLVWKSGFDSVYQYGISFKSDGFGNERFKPRQVVRTPEEAAQLKEGAFDYVILCIKALPDVYDIASVIDSVVTPQHTCILINTTHTLGIEKAIEDRFPTNVVLSLVSNAQITQLGASEFEHRGSTEIWVGPANQNSNIPASIQEDMAQALAMTLSTGQVDCKVSPNIRQQQYERVIGPIAFHPASVIFDTASHSALLEKKGVRELVYGVIDELMQLAIAQGCSFTPNFKDSTVKEQCQPSESGSIMWQDYIARRPMEVETYLGSPRDLARAAGVKVPTIDTLYAIFHHANITNQQRPKEVPAAHPAPSGSPSAGNGPMPRMSTNGPPPPRQMANGMPNGNGMGRAGPRPRNSSNYTGPPPGMRRGPPPSMGNGGPPNGYRGPPNGYAGSRQPSRRGSMEETDLNEFSHLMLYDDVAEAGPDGTYPGDNTDITLRERELQLRQRELALKEQEMRMRRGPPGPPGPPGPRRRPGPPPSVRGGAYDDEDEELDDFFDPNAVPMTPMIDPDNFDMMSVTSRKARMNTPNQKQIRQDPEMGNGGAQMPARNSRFRPNFGRNRTSQIGMASIPGLHENFLDDTLMSSTSNRYAGVDRGQMQQSSRANSLTAQHLDQMSGPGGMSGMNGPFPRRVSHSPGGPYSPSIRGGNGRPSPPNGMMGGPGMNGRPSPPDGMRQPVPRYPPGHGNAVAPQKVEQRVGVSALQPPKPKNVRSLTGSASASAGSGDSINLESEPSAHSSQSSLGPRPAVGVR
ncbi:alcohol dehydrogenase [Apiospora kogelbergensis]|uniref:Alcohol dehydrogenase n=1 Tax=Apiospora kogelbergensis TaxID=1337665 RepID=A0AAW0QPG8_9PEZI